MEKFFNTIGGIFLFWLITKNIPIDFMPISIVFQAVNKMLESSGLLPVLAGGIVIQIVFKIYLILDDWKDDIKRLKDHICK